MKTNSTLCQILPCFALLFAACTTTPKATIKDAPPKPIKVLILGDSISVGYTKPVGEQLGDRATVVRPMRSGGNRIRKL